MKLTPKDTVHNFCHACVCNRADAEVDKCGGEFVFATGKECPFYPYRNGDKRISVKVFRAFCLECQGGSSRAVEECHVKNCLVHPYRFGKNPAMAGRVVPSSTGLTTRFKSKEARSQLGT